MAKDDPKLQRELAEINARFQRHERMTRWVLTLVIISVALTFVVLAHLLLKAEGAL
jgi:uncharacterized membrane protein YhdT